MKHTLILTMLAVACVATALPTASACYSTIPAVNYAYCGGGAVRDAKATAAFALQEAGDVVAFLQSTEAWDLLP